MRAAVSENKKISIQDTHKPALCDFGNVGAIVKVLGCGLCGSDIVKFLNDSTQKVLGHEVVGEIVDIKPKFLSKFKIGDKIVLGHHVPCMKCEYCENKNYSMCKQFKETNIRPGGFAEYIYVSPLHLKNTVFKVPKNLDDMEISFMEPLACCVRAVKRAEVRKGSTSLIIGLGSIGLLMGQAVKAFKGDVIGCDLIEERVALANNLNFDASIKFEDNDTTSEKIKSMTCGIGADIVFMTSGSDKAIEFAIKSVRDGGTVLVFSSVPNDTSGYTNNDIYYRELKILGSYSPSPKDLALAHKLLTKKKVVVKYLSTSYQLEDLGEAIQDTISNKTLKAYIKVDNSKRFPERTQENIDYISDNQAEKIIQNDLKTENYNNNLEIDK